MTAGLWALVVTAVGFSVLAWTRPAVSSPAPQVIEGEEARWDVAGFAELFVAEFVEAGDGDEVALAPFLGGVEPAALSGKESGSWFVSSTTTTSITPTGDERWRVTVAADLLRSDASPEIDGSYVSLGLRFFDVEVVATGTGLTATGWPWMTHAPPTGSEAPDDWSRVKVPASDDPLTNTVERFLNALLTGNGELGRYAAPGSELRAVQATFESVTVERLTERRSRDGARWVRVWVAAESAGSVLWLSYDLRVEERDGRWEIAAMGPEPVADEPADPPATTSTVPVDSNGQEGN